MELPQVEEGLIRRAMKSAARLWYAPALLNLTQQDRMKHELV
jgi:hypothetical protein